ncbi:hypothetical protein Ancab_035781 [Ancistrocladus abbreviatus]
MKTLSVNYELDNDGKLFSLAWLFKVRQEGGNQQGHAVVEDVEPTTKEVEVAVEEDKVVVEADPFVDVHARPTNALIRVRHDNEWNPNKVMALVLAQVAIEDIVDDRALVLLIGEIKFPKHDDGEGCATAEEVDKGPITIKATNEVM